MTLDAPTATGPDPGPGSAAPGPSPAAPGGMGRATLVVALVAAVFFLPALAGPEQFLHRDTGRMHHPIKAWIAAELRRGHFPEWNPWAGLGYPVVGGAVDQVQHPFNLLLLVLPFEAAFKAWVLLCFLLAGTGAFWWARKLGAGFGAALGAGLGFMLSGFLVSSTDNLTYLSMVAVLPWMLGAAHAWMARGGPGRLALLGAASALGAAAGDPQGWGFCVGALVPYGALLAYGEGRRPWRGAVRGVLAAVACAVAAAPWILPVAAWLPNSTRGEHFDAFEYERFNLVPARLAELVLPHVFRDRQLSIWSDLYEAYSRSSVTPLPWVLSEYVGVTAVALALLGAARSRASRVLLAAAALSLWVAMGHYAGFGELARRLPLLSSFRYWEKVASWAHLLVPVAAASGIAALASGGAAARRFLVGVAAAGVALFAGYGAAHVWRGPLVAALTRNDRPDLADVVVGNLTGGLLHAAIALAALALVALVAIRGSSRRMVVALTVAVMACDLAVANVRAYVLYPTSTVDTTGPIATRVTASPGMHRVITPYPLWASPFTRVGENTGPHGEQTADVAWMLGSRSLAAAFNVGIAGNFEAYTGMIPARQMRFRRRTGLFHQLPAAGMWSVEWVVVIGDPRRVKEMGLGPPYTIAAIDQERALSLLDVPHRPRAYLAGELRSVDRRAAMEFALDPASNASGRSVLEAPVPATYRPPTGTARIVRDAGEEVVVEATSDGPALLVLNDNYAAGWSATVDGRPAEILPANYLARGVWIPGGTHTVAFRYRTPLLREGWALFLAGALGLALYALARRRAVRRTSPP